MVFKVLAKTSGEMFTPESASKSIFNTSAPPHRLFIKRRALDTGGHVEHSMYQGFFKYTQN